MYVHTTLSIYQKNAARELSAGLCLLCTCKYKNVTVKREVALTCWPKHVNPSRTIFRVCQVVHLMSKACSDLWSMCLSWRVCMCSSCLASTPGCPIHVCYRPGLQNECPVRNICWRLVAFVICILPLTGSDDSLACFHGGYWCATIFLLSQWYLVTVCLEVCTCCCTLTSFPRPLGFIAVHHPCILIFRATARNFIPFSCIMSDILVSFFCLRQYDTQWGQLSFSLS